MAQVVLELQQLGFMDVYGRYIYIYSYIFLLYVS